MEKVTVGIIGCGKISTVYFESMCNAYDILNVKSCADLDLKKSQEKAQEFEGVKAVTVDEIFSDPEIDIVVNLTIPQAHYSINKRALESGKHAYCEKPLTLNREEGRELLELAESKKLLLGCAPDTFLGAGMQTCRKVIDDGLIGKPIAAKACWMARGHEYWHPSPEFYYKKGGGPLLDMGPYYLTALTYILGKIKKVSGFAKKTYEQREIKSAPLAGQMIDVEVYTHIESALEFDNGVIGSLTTSFDIKKHNQPLLEIYGTKGALMLPNPNKFDDSIKYFVEDETEDWQDIPFSHAEGRSRGSGVADMAYAIKNNRPHRTSGELAYHVLDVMLSIIESSEKGSHIEIESGLNRPAAIPAPTKQGVFD